MLQLIKRNSKAIASGVVLLLGIVGVNQFTEANVGLIEALVVAVLGIVGVWWAPANS